jgi:hypothetical protein
MTSRVQRLWWFGGLYLASLLALALVTFVIRTTLSIIT